MPKKTDSYTHVEKNLYKDHEGFYHAARKMGGVRIWEALGTNQLSLARKLLHKWLTATDANPPCRDRDISLRQAIQMTLGEIERDNPRSLKTWSGNAGILFRACLWPGGADIPFADLTPEQCQTIFAQARDKEGILRPTRLLHCDLRKPKLIGMPIAASTFNHCHTLMSRVCRDRVLGGYRLDDPMARARVNRLPAGKIDRVTPSLQQFQAILTFMRRPHQNMCVESADMVQMAGEVGLGRAEMVKLKLGMLDYEVGAIQVTRVKTDHEFDIPFYPWSHELWNRVVGRATARSNGAGPDVTLFSVKSPAKALRAAQSHLARHLDHIGGFHAHVLVRTSHEGENGLELLQAGRDAVDFPGRKPIDTRPRHRIVEPVTAEHAVAADAAHQGVAMVKSAGGYRHSDEFRFSEIAVQQAGRTQNPLLVPSLRKDGLALFGRQIGEGNVGASGP